VLASMLHLLSHYYELLQRGETEAISKRYHDSLFRREGFHLYADNNGQFSARIVRIEPDGRLILCTESGEERGYLFKEVHCVL
jgi:BirA family transcriptional regulator, biotin operon repressor / biotin---[acetyl-CoA-carboxylase] ligase